MSNMHRNTSSYEHSDFLSSIVLAPARTKSLLRRGQTGQDSGLQNTRRREEGSAELTQRDVFQFAAPPCAFICLLAVGAVVLRAHLAPPLPEVPRELVGKVKLEIKTVSMMDSVLLWGEKSWPTGIRGLWTVLSICIGALCMLRLAIWIIMTALEEIARAERRGTGAGARRSTIGEDSQSVALDGRSMLSGIFT